MKKVSIKPSGFAGEYKANTRINWKVKPLETVEDARDDIDVVLKEMQDAMLSLSVAMKIIAERADREVFSDFLEVTKTVRSFYIIIGELRCGAMGRYAAFGDELMKTEKKEDPKCITNLTT